MKIAFFLATVLLLSPAVCIAAILDGHIIDASTGEPVPDSVITFGAVAVRGDSAGDFKISTSSSSLKPTILARAPGYRAASFTSAAAAQSKNVFALVPFTPHALYLSVYGIASKPLREGAFDIIRNGGANALVIDVKSDRGLLTYPSGIPLVQTTGARKLTLVPSLREVVDNAHQQGIYMIARVVTFKDASLGTARPDLAVHLANGSLFRDREGLTWTDPYQAEVRAYNISIAVEAAKAGFDEVQFDYVRFPDASAKLMFSGPANESGRINVLIKLLAEARFALIPYNVFEAVDIFGYVAWNLNDTGIGQQLDSLANLVDYLCPMLYPSGFRFGIPRQKSSMATNEDIYDIIRLTLENCVRRTGANPKKFRPRLQAFRDYAFGGKIFGPGEVDAQIRGAYDAGSDGWILWNRHNRYGTVGLSGIAKSKP